MIHVRVIKVADPAQVGKEAANVFEKEDRHGRYRC